MNKEKNTNGTKNNINNEVHIEQVNPTQELNDLEKTALFQFLVDEKENNREELNNTCQLKIINSKKKKVVTEFELPKVNKQINNKKKIDVDLEIDMPKKAKSLTDTIKIKLEDLKKEIDKREKEKSCQAIQDNNKKRSLYDTVVIKLDDIINNRKALKSFSYVKVNKIEEPLFLNKNKVYKTKDITKSSNFKLNINSEEFVSQLRDLNIIALKRLNSKQHESVRNNRSYKKNDTFEHSKIRKEDYLAYKDSLIEFAVDKLYYQYSLKETKKYKMYKVSVSLSILVFLITGLVILSWFIQGVSIHNLSNSLTEVAPVEEISDGKLINVELIDDIPVEEDGTLDEKVVKKNDMYWQYLNTPLSSVYFTELLKKNKDTVGWLIVNNTNINYPVVQTTNNNYYLNHAFDRSKNYAGWVFADFRNNFETLSQNTVIYAHGRKDGVMFGSLTNTLKKDWYTNLDNQIIQLSTLKYNTMWQIFSIYKIEAESYYITTDFSNDEDFDEFISTMKQRSIYDFGVDVTPEDKLLTLSTCYNDKGVRLVVQAKLVKIQTR